MFDSWSESNSWRSSEFEWDGFGFEFEEEDEEEWGGAESKDVVSRIEGGRDEPLDEGGAIYRVAMVVVGGMTKGISKLKLKQRQTV